MVMAGQVNVNPANLDRAANNLKGIADDAAGVKNTLAQAESTVSAAWQSRYTNQYLEEVRTVRNNMDKIAQKINSLSTALKQEAIRVRRVEEENRKAFAAARSGR
jgi:WXG100 family type VII secretion target